MPVTDTEIVPQISILNSIYGLFKHPATVAPIGTTSLDSHAFNDDTVIIDVTSSKRLERVKMCGKTWQWKRNFETGARSRILFKCKDYQNCPTCLNDRINKVKTELEPFCTNKELYTITTTPADWTNLRKIAPGSINFKCMPLAGNRVTAFINQELFDILNSTKYAERLHQVTLREFVIEYDWATMVSTPEGKRMTGKLGVQSKEEKVVYGKINERILTITRDDIMVDDYEIRDIDNEAMDATANLDPHTVIELQVAVDMRTDAFIAAAKTHGCDVRIQRCQTSLTIEPKSLRWLSYYGLVVVARAQLKQRQVDFRRSIGCEDTLDT